MRNDPFLTIDRAQELAGEQADDFDAELTRVTDIQAAAIRTAVLTGDEHVLASLAESLAHRMSKRGVTEQLIRTVLSCGPLVAGQMLLGMTNTCIEDDAETAALVEIERTEKEGVAV